ncbi:PASTA domain-containing protein [Sphingobacterium bovistauri]|uniref:PASTA domain-containing protein n=1 Tax=Sphingobacterium bovistauri TaxID=2781959 RepID=A0ABS7ZBI4_9SPHI|nr:PASTA domain-containing protein [Sphingobacterium bovistauri]MCA5006074.1 PASTA domain-containing protein [Sphingobacterium bovistauri]
MSKILLFLKTDVFRKNLIYAIIVLIVFFLAVYVGLRIYTKHGDAQEVPLLKGLTISEAKQILDNADLEYKIDSVYQMDAKPGMVIEQNPSAKALVKSGRTIYLTIITEVAPDIEFPNIIEKNLIEVEAILNNASLKIGDTIYINDIARDVVLDAKFGGQSIKTGRTIAKGSKITLILGNGRGSNEVEIPTLTNLTLSEAKFALIGLGLTMGKITGNIVDSATARVINQSPDSTSKFIGIGSPINLELSNDITPEQTLPNQ